MARRARTIALPLSAACLLAGPVRTQIDLQPPGPREFILDQANLIDSHDKATIPDFAYQRVAAGEPMPGVFVVDSRARIRDTIDEILLLDQASEQAEWAGIIAYLPL